MRPPIRTERLLLCEEPLQHCGTIVRRVFFMVATLPRLARHAHILCLRSAQRAPLLRYPHKRSTSADLVWTAFNRRRSDCAMSRDCSYHSGPLNIMSSTSMGFPSLRLIFSDLCTEGEHLYRASTHCIFSMLRLVGGARCQRKAERQIGEQARSKCAGSAHAHAQRAACALYSMLM